jgi:hypothetical protein
MSRRNNHRVRGVQYSVKLSLAWILSAAPLLAQTPDVQLRLATAGAQTSFRMGEPIGLELSFTSTAPGKYSAFGGGSDRMGMEALSEKFSVSPAEGATDPLADYFKGGMAIGGLGWSRALSAAPTAVKKDLNQWLRFDRPGHYRVRAISSRVSTQHKPVEVESNEIAIELVDDPAWRAARSAEASHILRTVAKSGDSQVFQQRMAAARQLWYLDTPDSIRESARLLDGSDVQVEQLLRLGLMASSRRALAIETMEGLLADPAQPIAPVFLETLSRLESSTTADSSAKLAGTLAAKAGGAKAVSLETLILAADSPASVSASQRAAMAGIFFELPADRQAAMLSSEWTRVSGPAMIPVLRKIYDAVPDSRNPPPAQAALGASAIERLYELEPAQGRALILAEMARPFPRFPFETLALLPDATLPELDEKWIANLELERGQAAWHEVEELIARYGTGAILGRTKAFYARVDAESRARPETVNDPPLRLATPACDPPLFAYFLRTDPEYGEKLLRGVMAERSFEMGRCWAHAIGETARYFVSPRWESVALDGLNDSTVAVKIDAVKALGRYGSPAALARLWDSLQYFHDWWKDRAGAINDENRQLEWAYAQTFPQAANWILTGDDLARAATLCITDGCRGQMEQNRGFWRRPLAVSIGQSQDGSYYANLAQYSMRSLEETRRRLLQLPTGTELLWKVTTWANRPAPELDTWVGQMQRELRDRGVTVAR